jgi:two-component system, NtrC family, sensor kinase
MSLQFAIILVIASYFRRDLKMNVHFPEWNKKLTYIIVASAILMISPYIFDEAQRWFGVFASIVLGAGVYFIYKEPFFKPYRFILVAVVPYVITSFLYAFAKLVGGSFWEEWRRLLNNANSFAVLWMMGVWAVTTRQRKELEKSRKKIEEERENSALIASMRDELEVQVKERTAELTRQKEELEITISELKATQAQLIQSEKMASLGELTAGIAHEIQNPLNFVNNFSDVSKELLEEMEVEMQKGDMEEALAIANDIKDNLEKIAHHGKRADGIVKGMLQHSRASTGQKELTDINVLADEYLRLAYHGLRAKDKTFNASLVTHFAEQLPKIEVVPQDIGRVLLNLFTNAFYAVHQKQKSIGSSFKPELTVTTTTVEDEVEIRVKDNGTGIPEDIKDKILQPFFTTKPTGEGTGLGLSLSYDIVVKGHGGSIDINSKEGKGAEFIIHLPL